MHTVFVYGTLRRGEGNHALLDGAKFLGSGRTVERMTMVNTGWFPAVIIDDGPSQIVGELFEVDDRTLDRLDGLECYPDLYDRANFKIETADGIVLAAMYFWPGDRNRRVAEIIPTGDWCDRTPCHTTEN